MNKKLPNINPWKTITKKSEKWDEWISWYEDYNGTASDSVIFLVESYDMPNEEWEKMIKFLETICNYDNIKYSWDYRDSSYVDHEDNCAYNIGYDESNVIFLDCKIIGRRQIENKEVTWDDLKERYINEPTKALPSWFPISDLEEEGFEERSCDFQNGMYGRVDRPKDIMEKLHNLKYKNIVFQIASINMFATDFCVWVKK